MSKIRVATMLGALMLAVPVGFAQAASYGPEPSVSGLLQAQDLLIANFDSKPDVDDLQAIAALGTILQDKCFSDINFLAVAGAYGVQGGEYVAAPKLFTLAFGDRWTDAHGDRDKAVKVASKRAVETLKSGADVWLQEAGQSDFSALLVQAIRAQLPELNSKQRIHTVQHSVWNEQHSSPDALLYVREFTHYVKIPDGNAGGNGTPGFNTTDGSWWNALLQDEQLSELWHEAKRLGDKYNIDAGYDNPSIGAGGFDFSETVEATWMLNLNHLKDVDEFFQEFVAKK